MHIEPGVVDGAKAILGFVTGAAAIGFGARAALRAAREKGVASVLGRAAMATALVFTFFEVLPHYPVGVSEVHFILGSTLFLIFGAGAAAMGLTLGLLAQGLFFAPFDLPQFGMNITTLLVPLFALQAIASRIIAPATPYVELGYGQALKLSAAYQGGIVAWVAFWALYGHGFTVDNFAAITSFGSAYMLVLLAEPLVDLGVLAAAKTLNGLKGSGLVTPRLYSAA